MSLGIVLTPYGHVPGYPSAAITAAYKGATSWENPFDPQFYNRGEAGYYYDTPLGAPSRPSWSKRLKAKLGLGAIPTDFDLAKRYRYLPSITGWVPTTSGYMSGGWMPPHGHYPGQPRATWRPVAPLNGLGIAAGEPTPGQGPIAAAVTAEDLVLAQQAHNDRIFTLSLISTSAVAVSALIGLFRTLKMIGEDR